jgi:hypothetical protein
MNPLPDRTVILALLATVGLCFALVFWFVRLQPQPEPPLQWRQGPSARLELQAAPMPPEMRL